MGKFRLFAFCLAFSPLLITDASAGGFDRPAPVIEAKGERYGGGYYGGPGYAKPAYRRAPLTCVAAGFRFFGRGPRIPGTRGVSQGFRPGRVCGRAIAECHHRLKFAPAGPAAVCQVVRTF